MNLITGSVAGDVLLGAAISIVACLVFPLMTWGMFYATVMQMRVYHARPPRVIDGELVSSRELAERDTIRFLQ